MSAQPDFIKEFDDVSKQLRDAENRIQQLEEVLKEKRRQIEETVKEKADELHWSKFRPEYLREFVEEPYIVEPFRVGSKGEVLEWKVYVPKCVEFQIGRLERATHSYNVFVVNQYMRWFAEIPKELEERFPQIKVNVKVQDGILTTPIGEEEHTWQLYKEFLLKREGPGTIRIKKGSEWELIAKILEDGALPFVPKTPDPADFRPRSVKGFALENGWEMRDYQKETDGVFMQYGAIGVYWPFGTGKSQYALDLCDRIKGPKLIIAGRGLALKEQWIARIKKMPLDRQRELHCVVFQSNREIDDLIKQYKEFTLIIYDECHHLPAKTFMRLSTIPTKYRLGLTGSPYREDGHINYIIALTGYPIGLAWSKFVTEGIISLAQVQVHVVKNFRDKLFILDQLLKRDLGKTMIFCDSLDLGVQLKEKYGLEFIHGETRNRIDTIERNKVVIISRVGDEGISIPALDTIVEIDFQGGSRAQALQRIGRLSHRLINPEKEPAVHHILITEEEVEKYGKRILAYYDKGFKVDWLYNM